MFTLMDFNPVCECGEFANHDAVVQQIQISLFALRLRHFSHKSIEFIQVLRVFGKPEIVQLDRDIKVMYSHMNCPTSARR